MLTLRNARRLVVLVVGGTVVLAGLALLVLPGPAMVVLPLGLAILATEFAWARRLLHRVKAAAGLDGPPQPDQPSGREDSPPSAGERDARDPDPDPGERGGVSRSGTAAR